MQDKIQIMGMIPHDGQVNRLRHNPLQFTKIASKTISGQIHIFSTSSYKKDKISPELKLTGHHAEGYAMEWSSHRNGHLVSGSYDGKLSLWDITKKQQDGLVNPQINFTFHTKQIEDVSFNKFHESIFISCDDNGFTAMWDTRKVPSSPVHHNVAHNGIQYGCQFSQSSQFNYLTCGSDSVVKLWDIRNLSTAIFQCEDLNGDQVSQVQWSKEDPATAWSISKNKATLWDLSTQKAKFVHVCCSQNVQNPTRINELSVNINQPDTVAVVNSNNEIQIFQPNQKSKL